MNTTRALALGLLAVLPASSLATARQESRDRASRLGSVSGHITVEGKSGAGLEVSLYTGDYTSGKPLATVSTEEDGRYNFSELPSAHYWITVESPEYVNAGNSLYNRTGRGVTIADGQVVVNA